MKPIIYSPHAHERLAERQVSREDIERTLRTPDLTQPARRGRLRAVKRFEGKALHVFYKELAGSLVVVTGYWKKG